MISKTKRLFKNFSFFKSEIYRKKHLTIFLVLFTIALAAPFSRVEAAALPFGITLPKIDIIGGMVDYIAKAALDPTNPIFGVIFFFIYNILNIFLNLASMLVWFGAWLIDIMLDPALYTQVLNSPAIIAGWSTIRDMANMFFIMILLLIAFSTILRISQYSAGRLLPRFIISLLLINFSAEIGKLIIDFGQVFLYEIRSWMGTFSMGGSGQSLTSVVDKFNEMFNLGLRFYGMDEVIGIAFALAYTVALGFIYIMLAMFLLIRLVMFAFLIILSPFAFFSIILPGMQRYTGEWWGNMVKYSIFGPIFIFFIYISTSMAVTLTAYAPPAIVDNPDMKPIANILSMIIPYVVSLAMLLFVVPLTQRIGVYGANSLIGGTLGIGKIAIGTYAGFKLAGGAAKYPVKAMHEQLKGRSTKYNKATEKVGGILKTAPLAGRVFIKREAEQAQERKEDVTKHQKVMENLSDKDKKAYVDSFKNSLDPMAIKKRADATQAMFNLMAKDWGEGLSDSNLVKMGYGRDKIRNGKVVKQIKTDEKGNYMKDENGKFIMENVKELDRENLQKDFDMVKAFGHRTSDTEKYRTDLIKKDKDRYEKFNEMLEKEEINKIKPESLSGNDESYLRKKMGDRDFEETFFKKKSQPERDAYASRKEDQLVQMYDDKGNVKAGKEADAQKLQTEIARLASSSVKLEKMKEIKVVDGQVRFEGKVDPNIAKAVIGHMTPSELGKQNPAFHREVGHMYDGKKQIEGIFKDRDTSAEVKIAIEDSLKDRIKEISENGKAKESKYEDELERLNNNLEKMGSKITKPTVKKEKAKQEKRPEDVNRDVY